MASEAALDASSICTTYPDPPSDTTIAVATNEQLKFARDFTHRLQRDGYVKLRNHGIHAISIQQAFDAHKTLFTQPLPSKLQLRYLGKGKPARGFTPTHSEKTFHLRPDLSKAGPNATETREQFTLGPPEDTEHPTPWFSPDASLDTTFSFLRTFYTSLRHIALKLMQSLELGLELNPGTLTSHFLPDAAEMLLNWYPEASRKELLGPRLKRIWPHSDLSIITLVFQDNVGGLEFEDRLNPGEFSPVQPDLAGEELIVNASDTLERWTNGVVKAGVHRVNVPAGLIRGGGGGGGREGGLVSDPMPATEAEGDVVPERRSIVFLYRADGKTLMGPLPNFVTTERPAMFDEMTAGEYLARKNRLTYEDVSASNNTQGSPVSLRLDGMVEAKA